MSNNTKDSNITKATNNNLNLNVSNINNKNNDTNNKSNMNELNSSYLPNTSNLSNYSIIFITSQGGYKILF